MASITRPHDIARAGHTPACRTNLSTKERIVSTSSGVALMLLGLRVRGKPMLLAELLGAALVRRGWRGRCELYHALGVNTAEHAGSPHTGVPAQHGVKIETQVAIDAYPAEVYRFWRTLENLPRFMRHLESVRQIDARHSQWVARGILGRTVEWDAEIINERENELIAWQSLPGSDLDTGGSVHFERLPNGHGTLVQVSLKYNPPGGRLGVKLAELLGEDAQTKIDEDLCELKHLLEFGEAQAAAQNSGARGAIPR